MLIPSPLDPDESLHAISALRRTVGDEVALFA
jgi:hypothetical protein